ncbi:MAG: hypothetical protein AAF804_07035 [Bacteroidota bacterium]
MPVTHRINLWSGPRNISTALMYSFAQRSDTQVFDEPLYAHYLKITALNHPGRAETLASMENDGQKVIDKVILGAYDDAVVFFKQMAKHLVELPVNFLRQTQNVLLIRDPREVLASFGKVIERPDPREVGYERLFGIWAYLKNQGQSPIVLDGNEVRKNPEGILTRLCAALELDFDPAMLSWEAGARPEDGTWAQYWYRAVHQSTGFEPYKAKEIELSPYLEAMASEQRAYFDPLYEEAIKA